MKSTTKSHQKALPISFEEIIFAQNYSSQYKIYQLCNWRSEDPISVEMKITENMPYLLNSHVIDIFLVI